MSGKPKYKTDEERIVARSASRKKYRQSEKGRKTKLEGMDRYLSTEYGNKKARDWRQSENGKKLRDEAYDRYIQTEYGKEERRLTHLNFMKGINARIAHNCRARVGRALKGLSKSNKTLDLIGCSIQELHERLERQFKYGMTWENYGEWHIDHILPCSYFDLACPLQQKLCFGFWNLQPLWGLDNISKGGRVSKC